MMRAHYKRRKLSILFFFFSFLSIVVAIVNSTVVSKLL